MSEPLSPAPGTCSIPGCGRPLRAKGLCSGHWRAQREGRPLVPLRAVSDSRRPVLSIRVSPHVKERAEADRDGARDALEKWAQRR